MTDPRGYLVDSNVLLDILTEDPDWYEWSSRAIASAASIGEVNINPIVYSEISLAFDTVDALDATIDATVLRRMPLPWASGFLAARAHQAYRRRGGSRESTLPDFFIGAHAQVSNLTLITRDARRYRTAFPELRLIAPGIAE